MKKYFVINQIVRISRSARKTLRGWIKSFRKLNLEWVIFYIKWSRLYPPHWLNIARECSYGTSWSFIPWTSKVGDLRDLALFLLSKVSFKRAEEHVPYKSSAIFFNERKGLNSTKLPTSYFAAMEKATAPPIDLPIKITSLAFTLHSNKNYRTRLASSMIWAGFGFPSNIEYPRYSIIKILTLSSLITVLTN